MSVAVSGCFILVDSAFFLANSAKIADGGYVPLALAAVIYGADVDLAYGPQCRDARDHLEIRPPIGDFMTGLEKKGVPRVPGTAVFLTRAKRGVPPVMAWHVKHNRALHEKVMVINVCVEPMPFVDEPDTAAFLPGSPEFLARNRPISASWSGPTFRRYC